jgi:type I restriction enzyme S subunit
MKQYDKYKPTGFVVFDSIPDYWQVKRLKDVVKFKTGGTPEKKDGINDDFDGYPWITAQDFLETSYIPLSSQYISDVAVSKYGYNLFPNGSVLLMCIASVGKVCIAQEKCYTNQQITALIPSTALINSVFLYYFFKFISNKIASDASCNVVPIISSSYLNTIRFPFPPIPEQTAIAAYLDEKTANIDRRIELLRNKIEHYKQLRRSLISQVVTRGLNPNVKLKPSGINWLGELPEHWQLCRLKDYCTINARIGWNGLRSDEFLKSGYAYLVTGQDFKESIILWNDCYQIDKERYEEDPFIQLSNGDILITKDGTIGKIAMVTDLDKPACLNSGIFVLKQKAKKFSQKYLYWLLLSKVFVEFNNFNKNGTTIMHLYQNVFDKMPMCIPPLDEQTAIAAYLDEKTSQIDNILSKCEKQIEQLTELRRSLIAQAVTGQIKVC